MNLVDIEVIEILGPPVQGFYKDIIWWNVPVKVDSWGHVYNTTVTCKTEAEALAVQVGYCYQG